MKTRTIFKIKAVLRPKDSFPGTDEVTEIREVEGHLYEDAVHALREEEFRKHNRHLVSHEYKDVRFVVPIRIR